jgi:MOSC domain-containing protein YiiM
MAKLNSINISTKKGEKKIPTTKAELNMEGIIGDAHSGDWHRMVSLLADESVEKMREKGLSVGPGDFAENLTTRGVDLISIPLKGRLRVGADLLLEVTQHGKECHTRCEIYHQAGDCVMPREGIFAKVITPGKIKIGDEIVVLGEGKN